MTTTYCYLGWETWSEYKNYCTTSRNLSWHIKLIKYHKLVTKWKIIATYTHWYLLYVTTKRNHRAKKILNIVKITFFVFHIHSILGLKRRMEIKLQRVFCFSCIIIESKQRNRAGLLDVAPWIIVRGRYTSLQLSRSRLIAIPSTLFLLPLTLYAFIRLQERGLDVKRTVTQR